MKVSFKLSSVANNVSVFLQKEQEIREEEQRSTMLPIITYDEEFDSMRQSDFMHKC